MLFAYLHPTFEAALQRIDKMGLRLRIIIRSFIMAGQLLLLTQLDGDGIWHWFDWSSCSKQDISMAGVCATLETTSV